MPEPSFSEIYAPQYAACEVTPLWGQPWAWGRSPGSDTGVSQAPRDCLPPCGQHLVLHPALRLLPLLTGWSFPPCPGIQNALRSHRIKPGLLGRAVFAWELGVCPDTWRALPAWSSLVDQLVCGLALSSGGVTGFFLIACHRHLHCV